MAFCYSGAVLVTGANGFVGRRLVQDLAVSGVEVIAVVRRVDVPMPPGVKTCRVLDFQEPEVWQRALRGVDSVVHLAGLSQIGAGGIGALEYVNVQLTRILADQAARAGVRRFLFMSSAKVLGESSGDLPNGESDDPLPQTDYARSKRDAEVILRSRGGPMAVTVIRPPMVYGAGAQGNFARLADWVRRERWLPLGSAGNLRSQVYVGNLTDAIRHCLVRSVGENRICHVTDGVDLSTAELIREMSMAWSCSPHLIRIAPGLLNRVLSMTGQGAAVGRLFNTCRLSMTCLPESGWIPRYGIRDALAEMAQER